MAQEQRKLLEQIENLADSGSRDALGLLLAEQRGSDIAEVVELLDGDQQRLVFDVLDRNVSAEVLEKVDEATRSELFELLGEDELTSIISELDADDAADVLAEMPRWESQEVLESISSEQAARIKDLMSYSEDSAGGIMDPVIISVQEDATVAQAIDRIRAAEVDEDFFAVFVTNRTGQYLGNVRIRSLIIRPEDARIKDMIDTDTIYVSVDTDQEEVRNIFKKNDLIVMPVVDKKHRLVGRITADRVIEVAEEEAAEDMLAMAGTDAAELESYSTFHAARVRMTWLLPCLGGTAVAVLIALFFRNLFLNSELFAVYATSVAFITMVAAISGNAGLQTSAIVVCGLATGDLAALNLRQVFGREVRIALIVAVCCGTVGAVICGVLPRLLPMDAVNGSGLGGATLGPGQLVHIAMALGIAMFTSIMVATTLGLSLPFLFRKVGVDPAIASGPLVTTANDFISVAIYMTLTMLLAG